MDKKLHELIYKFLKDYCYDYEWSLPKRDEFESNIFHKYVYYHWKKIRGEEDITYLISADYYSDDEEHVVIIEYFDNLEEVRIAKTYRFTRNPMTNWR